MKLLSPVDAQNKAKKSLDAEKYRLVEVQTLITQKYKELGQAEDDFAFALKNQRAVWVEELARYDLRVFSLRNEVESLEERRRQALIPLTERAKMLDTKSSVLDAREEELDEKDADLEIEKAILVTRLDEVAERELQADKVARTLTLREEGVKAQAAQVGASSASLTVAIGQADALSRGKERELTLKEATLTGRQVHLEERERVVKVKEAGFDNREKALQDERYVLTKAAEELKKQQNGTKQIIQRDSL